MTFVGAAGTAPSKSAKLASADGVTGSVTIGLALSPTALVATIANAYAVPFVRPVTVHVSWLVEQISVFVPLTVTE